MVIKNISVIIIKRVYSVFSSICNLLVYLTIEKDAFVCNPIKDELIDGLIVSETILEEIIYVNIDFSKEEREEEEEIVDITDITMNDDSNNE